MLHFYDEVFVPAFFDRWAKILVEKIPYGKYSKILDVATGPGTVITHLLRNFPNSAVEGLDPSEGFLGIARKKHTSVNFIQAMSECMPVKSESIDLVTCQQGIQYFPNKDLSMKEMARVLRKGGRFAFAIWSGIDESPQFHLYQKAMKYAGANEDVLKIVELPFLWSSKDQFEKLVASSGLKIISTEKLQSLSKYSSFPAVIDGAFGAPFGPYLMKMSETQKSHFEQFLREGAEKFRQGDQYYFPMSSHLIIGEK